MPRSSISSELKRQIVEKLLRGDMTVAEAAKEHKLHPYQVQAWVGQMTLKRGFSKDLSITSVRRGRSTQAESPADLVDILSGQGGSDPVREIGEWYIRTVILKEKGHKPPPGIKSDDEK